MVATAEISNDPFLAELNGALAKNIAAEPKSIDRALEQPEPLSIQLETTHKPAAALPQTTLIDKTHAKASGGNGYEVIVEGEYYASSTETKGHIIKPYRLPFNLPSLVNHKGEAALGIIVGKLLLPALRKMDKYAKAARTHSIVSATPLTSATPAPTSLQYMSFEALAEYVRSEGIPLNPEEYWDANHLRDDVIYLKTNAADGGLGAKKKPLDVVHERHEERKDKKALFDMNPGL